MSAKLWCSRCIKNAAPVVSIFRLKYIYAGEGETFFLVTVLYVAVLYMPVKKAAIASVIGFGCITGAWYDYLSYGAHYLSVPRLHVVGTSRLRYAGPEIGVHTWLHDLCWLAESFHLIPSPIFSILDLSLQDIVQYAGAPPVRRGNCSSCIV